MSNSATLREQAGSTVDDLKALLREAEQALSKSGEDVGEDVDELRERLRDVLSEGQATLKNLTASARRQVAKADETIRANPYQAIGIAAGIGLLAGYLLTRSCSSRE